MVTRPSAHVPQTGVRSHVSRWGVAAVPLNPPAFHWKMRYRNELPLLSVDVQDLCRLGKAPRTGELLSRRRGKLGERMKDRKIAKRKMKTRRGAEQDRRLTRTEAEQSQGRPCAEWGGGYPTDYQKPMDKSYP